MEQNITKQIDQIIAQRKAKLPLIEMQIEKVNKAREATKHIVFAWKQILRNCRMA